MARLYLCLHDQHDWRLLALAALIGLVAAGTTVYLMRLTRDASGLRRSMALAEAGVAFGFGIWATHFVAMLAFHPGVTLDYDLSLTGLSLMLAVVLTLASLVVATRNGRSLATTHGLRQAGWPLLGGALLGLGVAAMHATGIQALEVPGLRYQSMLLLFLSLLVGSGFGALGLALSLCSQNAPTALAAVLALLVAIVGHHALALGALDLGAALTTAPLSSPPVWLAGATAAASLAILLLAFTVIRRDRRQRRQALELARIRSLVDAAVEGLVICRFGIVVTANASFAELAGLPVAELEGRPFTDFLPPPCGLAWGEIQDDQRFEADLVSSVERIPVELIARKVDDKSDAQVAIAVRDLRERRRADESIRFLAHHDPLTGLANRASFEAALETALGRSRRDETPLALLCLDLDRFKAVNDTLGHAAGDLVLKTVARRVTTQLLDQDLFARLGGDEFAVLCCGESAVAVEDLASRIVATCAVPIEVGSTQVTIGSSVGIAIWPEAGTNAEALTCHADAALYCAKADGRSTWRRYEPAMRPTEGLLGALVNPT